jgi:2-dehydro-3-deoxygalactonokinase
MRAAAFIAGDWGTSNLRLRLYAADGSVLDSREGPGAADSRGRFAEVFDGLTAGWRERAALPALLCGMAGSAFGWVEAPYLLCPEDVDNIAGSLARARPDVHIVPGMRCANPLGAPDVMRGEETQLLGALALHPALARGRHLVCMPGTHTKWVALHDGHVLEFLTVPTGEIFRMLCDHSVLVRDRETPVTHQPRDFERGLVEAGKHAGVPLLHRVFQARSLRLDKQLSAEGAASWTSGLLIGTDCAGALPLFEESLDKSGEAPIYIVAAGALAELYATALAKLGRRSILVAGDDAAFGGLVRIHTALAGN